MTNDRWTNALLDRMRLIGDEPADRAVATIYGSSAVEWATIHRVLDQLTRNDAPLPAGLPAAVRDDLAATLSMPAPELRDIAIGEGVFAEYGPEILMLLGCYSLPAAYSAAKGAQVLCRTEFLERAARLRLFQTAQMVVDVMSPGGLGRNGDGIRTIQKVRLLHAAIRHLILSDAANPWDTATLGVPINQEDLAGTMLTFSSLVLEGLAKLDITLTAAQQTAYFDAWRAVGRLVGVREELIPDSVADGRALMDLIHQRQVAASPQGVRLTTALLETMSEGPLTPTPAATAVLDDIEWGVAHTPAVIRTPLEALEHLVGGAAHAWSSGVRAHVATFTAVLMRHVLSGECDASGRAVADLLQIPAAPPYADFTLSLALALGGTLEHDLTDAARRRRALRAFNIRLIDWMMTLQLGPGRPTFSVPDSLYSAWKHSAT